MVDSLLDKYYRVTPPEPPANDGGSLVDELRAERDREIAFRLSQAEDPDKVARANVIARQKGIPAPLVDGNLSALEAQQRAEKSADILRQYPAIGRWSANPRNVGAASDDLESLGKLGAAIKSRVVRDKTDFVRGSGFFDRMGDLFTRAVYSLDQGAASLSGALQEWSANNPLPWTSEANLAVANRKSAENRAMARIYGDAAGTKISGETNFGDLRDRPGLGTLGGFVLDQGVGSIPGMAMAAFGLPLYVASQAGSIGQNRAQNDGREDATIGDVGVALPAAVVSAALERVGVESIFGAPGKKALTRILQAGAGEGSTEFLQSIVEYAGGTVGTEAGFDPHQALEQGIGGAIAGVGMGAGLRGGQEIVTPAVRSTFKRFAEADAAVSDANTMDRIVDAAGQTKLKGRDPEAFSALLKDMAQDSDIENVYVPAEALQSYMQSDGYDGSFDSYRDAIDDGILTGGDVVIPFEAAVSAFTGSPAWNALKDDVRLAPFGPTRREALTFDEAMADVMADLTGQMEADQKRSAEEAAPREALAQSLTDKLMNAGYTPSQARTNAELLTQKAATRAQRMGRALTGAEFDALQINQVLPERLAQAQKSDEIDIVINAMKKGGQASRQRGASLLEYVAQQGGIEDKGGDLTSMGADKWHVGKPGKRKLIRETAAKGQGSMLGPSVSTGFGIDDYALRAWEAGYFPHLAERPTIQEFLDAVGEEMTGTPRYVDLGGVDAASQTQDKVAEAADELRALLENRGIDPDKATAKEIRKAIEGFANEQAQGVGYDQAFADGPRGRITFPAAGFGTGRTIIDLFQSRNSSTFLHEAGHMWLEELRFDASDPDAPQQLRDDWQAVQDWLKDNGHPLTDGTIPVEAHEMWARSVERYLMEGKAPVPALRKIFESIKSWLVQVYRTAAKLNAPTNEDIRAVMDRLIATDEEIAAARAEQSLEAAFTEKPATMSDAEWDGYKTLASDARATAYDTLLAKTMNAVKRRVTKEYQDQAAEVRKEVAADIDARPEFRALAAVRARPIDTQWIREAYGPDATAMLPKNVPPVFKNGGANPDEVAELIGYKSGDEMVRALMGLETRRLELREGGDQRSVREGLIQDEVNAQILARYGDPFTDGSIEEEALAAVHNEKQGELLAADLRILGRSAQKRPTPYSVAKAWAARSIREGKVSDMVSRSAVQRYRRAAQKAGKEALDAILEGAMEEAFQKKQAQMLNNALVSEATRVSDEVDKAVARLSKWAGKVTVKTIDQDYLERAQALLEQVDLRPRSQRSIERQAQFEAWAQEQTTAGHDIVVPPSFAASLGSTHWSRLSVDQLLGLDAAVEQIIHLGRFKQTLLDNKARRDFDEVRSEALGQMGGMDKRPPSDLMEPSWGDAVKGGVLSAHSIMLKIETVFDVLDSENPNGVFNRIVFRPLADAQHNEQAMLREYITKMQELTRALPKETVKAWRRKFTDPRLVNRETGNPFVMTRDQLIAIALNMGNASNRAKLTGGYGWDADAVMAVLNENLSAAEWEYVQATWDTIESLWPKIEAMEKRLNGVAPEKVEPEQIVTSAGVMRGGYYPVVYDPAKSIDAEVAAAKSSDLFENIYTRAATSRGFTKARTDVERPVWLNIGVIERHLSEVIHDVTHREAIMQADKFLSDRRIAQAVDETLGPEVRRQFRPWLQHIANEWAYDRAGMGGAEKFIRAIRRNTTFVGMGFRASTVLMQLAGFSDSTGTIGEKAMIHGLTRFSTNPKQAIEFVLEKSGEVRSRMDTLDRDIREAARRHAGHINVLSAAQRFGYMGIGWADRLVVVPTWIGAYDKALASGLSEADAIYAADKAVRVSQGSGAAKDLAAIQRGRGPSGEAFKLLTMFFSYASGYYQRLYKLGRDVRRANTADIPNLVARSLWLVIVPALAAELLAGRGPDEDDEEGWGEWAFEKIALSMFNPIPIARDIAPIAWAKATDKPTFGYSFTPVARGFETIANVFGDLGNVVENEDTKRATRNFLEATGYVTGVVPGQAATAAQFLVDIGYGEQDPQTIGEWLEGLQKGKVSED
jgi:hypothetical protein